LLLAFFRKDGQNSSRDLEKRDLRAELEEKERKYYTKKRCAFALFCVRPQIMPTKEVPNVLLWCRKQ
jgi:hypothetical protein